MQIIARSLATAGWIAIGSWRSGALAGLLLIAVASTASAATTYAYTGPFYDSFNDFTTPCAVGSCANYTASMHLTGSFTTATPLAANLSSADVRSQVTSFSFNDGLTTYASSDPNVRLIFLDLSTDASGVPVSSDHFIVIQQWASGTSPHSAGDRLNEIFVDPTPDDSHNLGCTTVGTQNGVADVCTGEIRDNSASEGETSTNGSWVVTAGPPGPGPSPSGTPVPTLSTWALAMLAALVALLGPFLRRRGA